MECKSAKDVLFEAYYSDSQPVNAAVTLVLINHPDERAEAIYLKLFDDPNFLDQRLYIAQALNAIKSKKANRVFGQILDDPQSWREYKSAYDFMRMAKGEELPEELVEALSVLSRAKYNSKIDRDYLLRASELLLENKDKTIVNLLDIWFRLRKGSPNPAGIEIITETIKKAGESAYPIIKKFLNLKYDQEMAKKLLIDIGMDHL